MISRRSLLKRVETVAPALAENSLEPVWTHLLFTGKRLLAYNDKIAISTPMHSAFVGTVPGKLLFDLITMGGHVVTLKATEDGHAELGIDRSKFKLAMFKPEDFPFEMPAMPKDDALDGIAVKFFQAIEHCLLSVSEHATISDQLGITVIPKGRELLLFSTNRQTVSHAILPLKRKADFKRRAILSAEFCQQMLRLAQIAQTSRFALRKDHAMFLADDTILFGRLLPSDEPLGFEDALARHMPPSCAKAMVEIPQAKMRRVLQHAARIADLAGNEAPTSIEVQDGMMYLKSKSNRGEVLDKIALPGHPNAKMEVQVSLLLAANRAYDKILFGKESVVMAKGDNLFYLAASYGG